jgi:hypothetical protein
MKSFPRSRPSSRSSKRKDKSRARELGLGNSGARFKIPGLDGSGDQPPRPSQQTCRSLRHPGAQAASQLSTPTQHQHAATWFSRHGQPAFGAGELPQVATFESAALMERALDCRSSKLSSSRAPSPSSPFRAVVNITPIIRPTRNLSENQAVDGLRKSRPRTALNRGSGLGHSGLGNLGLGMRGTGTRELGSWRRETGCGKREAW